MQMRHSGVDKFVISWLRTKAPDIKTTTVVDRSRSAIKKSWACIVSTAFDVMIFYISLDDKFSSVICRLWMFQISAMANFETGVYDQHLHCSATPKFVQASQSHGL